MLRIMYELMPNWPKLAWVAVIGPEKDTVRVLHGPMVEVRDAWAIEGVWDGAFEEGAFDRTDTIFGSGIRQRGDELLFVSSATGVDRLWHVTHAGKTYVSNTLPGLLKISELSLMDDYPDYSSDMESIEHKGLYSYVKKIPSAGPDIGIIYYNNIRWREGEGLTEVVKPDCTQAFIDFRSYEKFLKETARNLGNNARDPARTFQVGMLVGLSSGYDSVATAVVAKYAGCCNAASIVNPTSFWRGSDSGKHLADQLGIECRLYRHDRRKYCHEIATWAGAGNPGGRNLTLFDYPQPLCLYFSGMYGDTVWNRHKQGLTEPRGDIDALLCEFRLIEGVFITSVPWWGIQRAADIQLINRLEEMKPWTLGTDYDRPIARRIIEEAGIPRGDFAVRKKDTASNSPLRWPSTSAARMSLAKFLSTKRISVPNSITLKCFSVVCYLLNFIYKNTIKHFGIRRWWRPWMTFPSRRELFLWANYALRDYYYC